MQATYLYSRYKYRQEQDKFQTLIRKNRKRDEKIVAISKEITPIADEIRLCDNILKRAEEIKKRELHHKLEEEKTLFAVKKKKSKSRER